MCVSLFPAHFSDTIVGAFEGTDGRRYLAYQNTAANLASGAPQDDSRCRHHSQACSPRHPSQRRLQQLVFRGSSHTESYRQDRSSHHRQRDDSADS